MGLDNISRPQKHINNLYPLVLYTGTRLYRNTGLVALISEPVFPLLSIRYSFRYIFSPKYKSTSFAVNKVENLSVNFCFVLNWTFPLFCADARLPQRARFQEIYFWDDVEGRHSRWHLSNKTMFLL